MIQSLLQNIHNSRYVQQNIGSITNEYLEEQKLNDDLIINIYKIQFILKHTTFIKVTCLYLVKKIDDIVITNDTKDIIQYIFTNMIRVSQVNGEIEFNNFLKQKINKIIQFAIKNDLEYLFYEILRILDAQSIYYLFMTTKKFFNCFSSVYLKDNAFKHNQIDLKISLQQATDSIQLLMFLLQYYTCAQYQIRPITVGPNWENAQKFLASFRVHDSDICSILNLLALFFAYLNRLQLSEHEEQNVHIAGDDVLSTSTKSEIDSTDDKIEENNSQLDSHSIDRQTNIKDIRLKFIYSEQNTSDKQLKINKHMTVKLLQSNRKIVKQLKKINQAYGYVFDYEIIGLDVKKKKQKYYISLPIEKFENPLQDNVVDIDIISYFVNQYFYELLVQLDAESNYQYNENDRFVFGSQFYSLSIIYSQLRQYYKEIDSEQCEKLCFGIPSQMVCRVQDGAQNVIKKVSKDPKNVLISTLRRLVSVTYDNQNEKEEKLHGHIQKMMMLTPLIGSSFSDIKQRPILKDLSFFYQEQVSRYYETMFNKNMAIVFGQDPDTFTQTSFLRNNVTDKLNAGKIKADITGLTSIHIKNYQIRRSINKNYQLIGSIAIFIMMNIEYFTMQEVFSSDSFEFVMSCLVKAIKKKSRIKIDPEELSDAEIHQNMVKFVEQNEAKSFSIVFTTDKEKLVKEFLIYKQSKVDILSCYQTRIPLPDIYFYNYTFHDIVGMEEQLNFCSLIITSRNYSGSFIERYFTNSSQQAVFYLQPILSIIFQSKKSNYDHILNNISRAFVKRHEILRTECVIYTFGSALEAKNEGFEFKQFIMSYMSQFGNQLDLNLLLVQSVIRQENFKGINKTILENYSKDEVATSNVQLRSLSFGNNFMLTPYQYQKLLKYEKRLFGFALDHLEHFTDNILKLDTDTIIFNLTLITDYIWQKRFTNMLQRLDSQQNMSYYSQIYNYGEKRIPEQINSLFNSTLGESDVGLQTGTSHVQIVDKTDEYFEIVKENFQLYIEKSIKLFGKIRSEIQLNVHDAEFYNKQFRSNLKAIQSICSFNQVFVKKTKQCDPRSLIIDPFSVVMLNPYIEIDQNLEPLMDFYKYQLQQINNQYHCDAPRNCLDNYFIDRFLCSLVRIGAIKVFDEEGNVLDDFKQYFNAVFIAKHMK